MAVNPDIVGLRAQREWNIWCGLAALLAVLPILFSLAADNWQIPALRAYPIALVASVVAIAMVLRSQRSGRLGLSRCFMAVGFFTLGAVVALIAGWQLSGVLAIAASVVLLAGWAMGATEAKWSWGIGWGVFIAIALDICAIGEWIPVLQTTAAAMLSNALDYLSIPNLRNGSLVEIEGMSLFCSYLCGSGVDSVFSAMILVCLLLAFFRKGLITSLAVLVFTPLAMLVSHLLMLGTMIWVFRSYERDLTSGMDFQLLRGVAFVFAMGLAFCFMRLLDRFTEPIPPTDGEFGPMFSALNKLLCWPQADPFEDMEPQDPDEARHFKRMKAQRAEQLASRPTLEWTERRSFTWIVRGLGILLFAQGGLLCFLLATGKIQSSFVPETISSTVEPRLASLDLAEFGLGTPTAVNRYDGATSLIWRGDREGISYSVEVTYPISSTKSTLEQRAELGWEAAESSRLKPPAEGEAIGRRYELDNELGGKAYLWSRLADSNGRPLSDDERQSVAYANAWEALNAEVTRQAAAEISLLAEPGVDLNRMELLGFDEFYAELIGRIANGLHGDETEPENATGAD